MKPTLTRLAAPAAIGGDAASRFPGRVGGEVLVVVDADEALYLALRVREISQAVGRNDLSDPRICANEQTNERSMNERVVV